MAGAAAGQKGAVFTTGNTMRHVVVMTATSSVGLVSIFFVDALNLYYISLLGEQALAAAVGYAATIMFFSISICIGVAIAATAIVGRAIGAGDENRSKQLATSALFYLLVISGLFAGILFPTLPYWLSLLGAEGETAASALRFMRIVVPSIPLLGLSMVLGGLLRAKGDPKRAMYVTLISGAAAAVLDPLFIIGFDWGLEGAAIAVFCARFIMVLAGFWCVIKLHNMLGQFHLSQSIKDAKPFLAIALPAIATQLATPVGNAYITQAIATFGDDAVAGWAIIGRLIPVAFGTIFALSGAVGPILSQNYGAKLYPRITQALRDALLFTIIYCLTVWALLALASPYIINLFNASNQAAHLISLFCMFVAGSFLFNGILFVSNAAFNNLGHPLYATVFNWGRATLGIIPFVMVGKNYGAEGVLIGWGLGAIVFGIASILAAFYVIKKLPEREDQTLADAAVPPTANSPFTSGKGASFGVNPNEE